MSGSLVAMKFQLANSEIRDMKSASTARCSCNVL